MKRSLQIIFTLLAFTFLAAGCSDSSGSFDSDEVNSGISSESGDTSSGTTTEDEDSSTSHESENGESETEAEITESAHVKIENVSGGIRFTITKPDTTAYDDGISYLTINRYQNEIWTVFAELDASVFESSDIMSVLYPFCSAGEKYEFVVNMEPMDKSDRTSILQETVSITATGGSGDIGYSDTSVLENVRVTLAYTESKDSVIVILTDYVMPDFITKIKPFVCFFAGNGDWSTDNASVQVYEFDSDYQEPDVSNKYEFEMETDIYNEIIEKVKASGVNDASTFFADVGFEFMPEEETKGVTRWQLPRSPSSNILSIEQ